MKTIIVKGNNHFVLHDDHGHTMAPQTYHVFLMAGKGFSQEVYSSYYKACALKKFKALDLVSKRVE